MNDVNDSSSIGIAADVAKPLKPQKTIKAQILDANGKKIKGETEERVLWDLNHPNCPPKVSEDMVAVYEGTSRKGLKLFLKLQPEFRKAMKQSSGRARRRVRACLDPIQRFDDWMCSMPYGLGLGYRVGTRVLFVVSVSALTRGAVRVR